MQIDPFTGQTTRIHGSRLLDREEHTALQNDHERRLEALARLREAATRVGFGTDPDDDLVLFPEDELSLLAGADAVWRELHAAIAAFRQSLPLITLEQFGFPENDEDPFGEGSPKLRRIGSGVEASAFQSDDGSIYKFYLPREGGRVGGSFEFMRGNDEVAWIAEANLGSYRDLLEKLLLVMALDGMPTEIVGITPEGVIVAKQTFGEKLSDATDTSDLQPAALIPIPARFLRAHRDHPRLFFFLGQPWLIADLHGKNLVRANDGTLRAIDLLAAPFPARLLQGDPLWGDWMQRVRLDPHATALRSVADDEL